MKRTKQLSGPQLITYVDRLGGTLKGLNAVLTEYFPDVFSGVHLLPYFTPFDGTDAGFDPIEHNKVDPRLGTWADVRELSRELTVVSDVIVNHVSADSKQFKDFRALGEESKWADLFLTMSSIYPDSATEADLAKIYRPRPGLPFTLMDIAGTTRLVWTTFTGRQVDIDLRKDVAWEYLLDIIDTLTKAGVSVLRLDAIGYTGKERGTNCFMTESTREYVDRIVEVAHARGAHVLLEVHGHFTQQIEAATQVDYVYDFALPPLVLHALHTGDVHPLEKWFSIRPTNSMTVLDTHDGIGIVDVGENDLVPGASGLLEPSQIDNLVEAIHMASGETSRAATGSAASNLDLYQVNCTFYDALGGDDNKYLLARLIQLMAPGIPQVYYVGLLAGRNDMALLKETGVGRDVNRQVFSEAEIQESVAREVVRAQINMIRLRNTHRAFGGQFSSSFSSSEGLMRWDDGEESVVLNFDADTLEWDLSWSVPNGDRQSIDQSLFVGRQVDPLAQDVELQ